MQYAIYNSSYTEPNYDDWKQPVSATKTADNTWTATSTEGIDLLNGLYKGSSYVIEFYFEASDGSNTVYYKNGEQNYKVQFTVANNNDAQVTLQQGSNAAGIGLKLNGIALNVKYDSDLNRTPAGDLSDLVPEVTTASITSWFAKFVYKKLISSTSRDASMQYRVYEQGMEGTWNRVDYSSSGMSAGGGVFNFTVEKTNLDINLLENTEPGKTYVLEIMYQFIDNTGSEPAYYFFGRDNANCRATFKVASSTGISSIHHSPFTIDSDAPMYNLAGQKVGKGYKGIIIRNGKKVVMK